MDQRHTPTYLDRIVKGPHPILARACDPVSAHEKLNWLDDLERITRKCKAAVGLAAPQIGIAKRAFFTLVSENGTVRGRMFINPEILEKSAETNLDEEGCLSYPGVLKAIARHDWILVRYCDRTFIPREKKFNAYLARVIQHEMDHLDGICKVGDDSYPADGEIERSPRGLSMAAVIAAVVATSAY